MASLDNLDPAVAAPLRFLGNHGFDLSAGSFDEAQARHLLLQTPAGQSAGYRRHHVEAFLARLRKDHLLQGQNGTLRYFGPLPALATAPPPVTRPDPLPPRLAPAAEVVARGAALVAAQGVQTAYWNTPLQRAKYSEADLAMDRRMLAINRYNALVMVLRANRKNKGQGGHLGTGQSTAAIRQVLFNHWLRPQTDDFVGDVFLNEGHDSPLDYADALLRRYLTLLHADNFRIEDDGLGLPGYGHGKSDTLFPWPWATVSMGLAPQLGIQLAFLDRLARNRGVLKGPERHIYVMLGDASLAEPESRSDIQFAAENGLDNITFILNANTNGLDGVILPDDQMVQYVERTFGAHCYVIKLVTSSDWNELILAGGTALQARWEQLTDGELQRYTRSQAPDLIRDEFFGTDSLLAGLVADKTIWTDERLRKLFSEGRGGHDLRMINDAFTQALQNKGKPTVIAALTTKGRGMGKMESAHVVHNSKEMDDEDLMALARQLALPLTDAQIKAYEFYLPEDNDPVMAYIRGMEEEKGGDFYFGRPREGKPRRRSMVEISPADLPPQTLFAPYFLGQNTVTGKEIEPVPADGHTFLRYLQAVLPAWEAHEHLSPSPRSTTTMLVDIIDKLMGDSQFGRHVLFIVADEITTFGAHTLPPKYGYFSPQALMTLAKYKVAKRKIEKEWVDYDIKHGKTIDAAVVNMASQALRDRGTAEAEIPQMLQAMPTAEKLAYQERVLLRYQEFGLPKPPEKVGSNDPVWVNDGQIVQVGINEARGISFLTAAGKEGFVPIWMVYSAFGFRRVGDQILAATDMRARGIIVGATAGGTTLNGEGLLHQERSCLLKASENSAVLAFDPAFAFEHAVIMENALHRMYGNKEDVLYYITAYNEDIPQPRMPGKTAEDQARIREGILKGGYLLSKADELFGPPQPGKTVQRVKLFGSGALLLKQLQAQRMLAEMGIYADVYSVTSYSELRRDALDKERELSLVHPGKSWKDIPFEDRPYIMQLLRDDDAPVIAMTDYLKMVPDQIARWLPRNYVSLGTDGFGRSSTRESLREYFEIAPKWIVYQAAIQLARKGEFMGDMVALRDKLGIDPDKPNPSAADPRAERLRKRTHSEIRRAISENQLVICTLAGKLLLGQKSVPVTKSEEWTLIQYMRNEGTTVPDWKRFHNILLKPEGQAVVESLFDTVNVERLYALFAWAAGEPKTYDGKLISLKSQNHRRGLQDDGHGMPPSREMASTPAVHAAVAAARPITDGVIGKDPTVAQGARILVGDFPDHHQTVLEQGMLTTVVDGNTLLAVDPSLLEEESGEGDTIKPEHHTGRSRPHVSISFAAARALHTTRTARPLTVFRGGF